MTAQHFRCTACGQCCRGWLPLTLADAFAHVGRFPLAMVWTPVPQSSRAYAITARLGTVFDLPGRKKIAVLLSPTAYLPPEMACPALLSSNLCSIHETKPLRCKTMPFFPYWEETDQRDMLVPRKGWACDVSADAPVVYEGKKIVDRALFDAERAALLDDAKVLKEYADRKWAQNAPQKQHVIEAAKRAQGGRYIENFSSFIRHDRRMDLTSFALAQHPVLAAMEASTAGQAALAPYNRFYKQTAAELEGFVRRASA